MLIQISRSEGMSCYKLKYELNLVYLGALSTVHLALNITFLILILPLQLTSLGGSLQWLPQVANLDHIRLPLPTENSDNLQWKPLPPIVTKIILNYQFIVVIYNHLQLIKKTILVYVKLSKFVYKNTMEGKHKCFYVK